MVREESGSSIERFIRNELGCQCPDAVLRHIELEACPDAFGYWPQGRLIRVGGRLLILVLNSDDSAGLCRTLPDLFDAGRRARDARAYNRFRLVIATSCPDALGPALMQRFESLTGSDERMHLHVLAREHVPAMFEHA